MQSPATCNGSVKAEQVAPCSVYIQVCRSSASLIIIRPHKYEAAHDNITTLAHHFRRAHCSQTDLYRVTRRGP